MAFKHTEATPNLPNTYLSNDLSRSSLVAQMVKSLSEMQVTRVRSLCWEDPLEKEMATHSSILARGIPRTEDPGGLQSMGCKETDMTERLTLSNIPRWLNH